MDDASRAWQIGLHITQSAARAEQERQRVAKELRIVQKKIVILEERLAKTEADIKCKGESIARQQESLRRMSPRKSIETVIALQKKIEEIRNPMKMRDAILMTLQALRRESEEYPQKLKFLQEQVSGFHGEFRALLRSLLSGREVREYQTPRIDRLFGKLREVSELRDKLRANFEASTKKRRKEDELPERKKALDVMKVRDFEASHAIHVLSMEISREMSVYATDGQQRPLSFDPVKIPGAPGKKVNPEIPEAAEEKKLVRVSLKAIEGLAPDSALTIEFEVDKQAFGIEGSSRYEGVTPARLSDDLDVSKRLQPLWFPRDVAPLTVAVKVIRRQFFLPITRKLQAQSLSFSGLDTRAAVDVSLPFDDGIKLQFALATRVAFRTPELDARGPDLDGEILRRGEFSPEEVRQVRQRLKDLDLLDVKDVEDIRPMVGGVGTWYFDNVRWLRQYADDRWVDYGPELGKAWDLIKRARDRWTRLTKPKQKVLTDWVGRFQREMNDHLDAENKSPNVHEHYAAIATLLSSQHELHQQIGQIRRGFVTDVEKLALIERLEQQVFAVQEMEKHREEFILEDDGKGTVVSGESYMEGPGLGGRTVDAFSAASAPESSPLAPPPVRRTGKWN